ncbi:hypothetical protein ACJX0J_008617, partial [Zea mays]
LWLQRLEDASVLHVAGMTINCRNHIFYLVQRDDNVDYSLRLKGVLLSSNNIIAYVELKMEQHVFFGDLLFVIPEFKGIATKKLVQSLGTESKLVHIVIVRRENNKKIKDILNCIHNLTY